MWAYYALIFAPRRNHIWYTLILINTVQMQTLQMPTQTQVDLLKLAKQLADLPANGSLSAILEGCSLKRRQIMR